MQVKKGCQTAILLYEESCQGKKPVRTAKRNGRKTGIDSMLRYAQTKKTNAEFFLGPYISAVHTGAPDNPKVCELRKFPERPCLAKGLDKIDTSFPI
jgi:hypothetical protein